MAKQLNVNLAFTADTGKAKAQLQDLQKQLDQLTSGKTGSNVLGLGDSLTQDVQKATASIAQLKTQLIEATTSTGTLDLGKFNASLKSGGISLEQYRKSFEALGDQGYQAFSSLTTSILNAEAPVKRVNARLAEMKTTLANTARWQLSSSILHGFMGAVQSAYGYAQDLNESLNNIRIVTGYNTDQMSKFAEEANKAAKALSTTTTNYTDASLIYYQQGLTDQEVKERTDVTIKMANAAGVSAEIASDQLTAVWNNFYDGSKSLEYYADVMTKLGAATASSTDEIAEGLEKFASVADTVGLSYEYATAALATVTAETRQSADVVGTAFKTLFARLQDLELGETLDDGTTLGTYSEALEQVGISIKDTNGELKDMDVIIDELGAKWDTLGKDTQVALAQTVAGTRQYTQLVALMDNYSTFQENLDFAYGSEGALQEQADIYAESWQAASDRVRAALEGIYQTLIDDDAFINILNGFEKIISGVDQTIDAMGGLKGVLATIIALFSQSLAKSATNAISNMVYNIKNTTKAAQKAQMETKKQAVEQLGLMSIGSSNERADSAATTAAKNQAKIQMTLLQNSHKMSDSQKLIASIMSDINQKQSEIAIKTGEAADEAEREAQARRNVLSSQKAGNIAAQMKTDTSAIKLDKTGSNGITARRSIDNASVKSMTADLEAIQKSNQTTEAQKKTAQELLNILNQCGDEALIFKDELDSSGKVMESAEHKAQNFLNTFTSLTNQAKQIPEVLSGDVLAAQMGEVSEYQALNLEVEELSKNLSNFSSIDSLDFILQDVITLGSNFEETKQDAQDLEDWLKKLKESGATAFDEASADGQKLSKILEQLKGNVQEINLKEQLSEIDLDLARNAGLTRGKNILQEGASIEKASKVTKYIEESKDSTIKWDQAISAVAQTTTSVISLWTTVDGVIETVTDSSLSFGQKLGSSLSAIGTQLPSIIMMFTSLNAAMGPAGLVIAGIGAAIGIVGPLVIKAVDKAKVTAEEAFEAAQEANEQWNTALDDTIAKVEELESLFGSYDSAVKALNECTKGATEWNEALSTVQSEMQNILNAYPELKQMSNLFVQDRNTGLMMLNQDTLNEYLSSIQQGSKTAFAATQMSDVAFSQVETARAFDTTISDKVGYESMNWTYGNMAGSDMVYNSGILEVLEQHLSKLSNIDINNEESFRNALYDIFGDSYQDASGDSYSFDEILRVLTPFKDEIYALALETSSVSTEMRNAGIAVAQNTLGLEESAETIVAAGAVYTEEFLALKDSIDWDSIDSIDDELGNTGKNLGNAMQEASDALGLSYKTLKGVTTDDAGNKVIEFYDTAGQLQIVLADIVGETVAASGAIKTMEGAISDINITLAKYNQGDSQDFVQALMGGTNTTAMVDFLSSNLAFSEMEHVTASDYSVEGEDVTLLSPFLQDLLGVDVEGFNTLAETMGTTGADLIAAIYEAAGIIISDDNTEWNRDFLEDRDIDTSQMSSDEINATKTAYDSSTQNLVDQGIIADTFGILRENSGESGVAFLEALATFNPAAEDAEAQLQSLIDTYGVSGTAVNDLVNKVAELPKIFNISADGIQAEAAALQELVGQDGLQVGDEISKETLMALQEAGINTDKYFKETLTGSYELVGAAEDFNNAVNNISIDKLKQQIEENNNIIDSALTNAGVADTNRDNVEALAFKEDYTASTGTSTAQQVIDTRANMIESVAGADGEGMTAFEGFDVTQADALKQALAAIRDDTLPTQDGLVALAHATAVLGQEFGNTQSILSSTITTLGGLSAEINAGNINMADVSSTLTSIASQYENTADEIADYQRALEEGNEETIHTAEESLVAATRAAELGEQYDIAAEEIEDYAKQLKDSGKYAKSNGKALAEMAKDQIRYDKAIKSCTENMENWQQALEDAEDTGLLSADTAEELADAYGNMFDIDGSQLSKDFLKNANNLKLLEEAANGSEEAYNQLQQAIQDDLNVSLNLDGDEKFLNQVNEIENRIANVPTGMDISAYLDDAEFLNELTNLVNAAGMTAEQATDYLSTMGIDAEVITEPETTEEIVAQEVVAQPYVRTQPYTYAATDGSPTNEVASYPGVRYSVNPITSTKETSATSLRVTSASKSSGGNIKHSGSNAAKSAGRSSGGSGGGGGGGGGGGSSNPAEKVQRTHKSDVVDRYKEITDKLDDISHEMSKQETLSEKLYGKSRIDAMKKIADLLKDQASALRQKRQEAEAYLASDKAELNEYATSIGFTVKYDAEGNISNYTSMLTKLWEELAAAEAEMDSLSTKEAQDEYQESTLDPIQEKIDYLKEYIERYEDSKETIEEINEELDGVITTWQENNYEQLTYALELNIEINDDALQTLEYFFGKLEDDFYKSAEGAQLLYDQASPILASLQAQKDFLGFDPEEAVQNENGSYSINSTALTKEDIDPDSILGKYGTWDEDMQAFVINEQQMIEALQNAKDAIIDNLEALTELDESMLEYYGETLDAAEEELEKYTSQMEHHNEVLEHYRNIVELIGGEKNQELMNKILESQITLAANTAAASKAWYEELAAEKAALEAQKAEAISNNATQAEIEVFDRQLEDLSEHLNEAEAQMYEDTEAWLEALQELMVEKMSQAAEAFEKALTKDGLGFDYINESMESLNIRQDEYLTKTNQIYETNKMMRELQTEIDETSNVAAKQRLKNFQKEIEAAQEQNELSEYELEILQAKMELELAQIALEEAQNAKSQVRLTRDSEGNFSYVYTADQDKIADAQADFEDAQNNLYNLALDGANRYTEMYVEAQQSMYDELTELSELYYVNGEITEEEFQARKAVIIEKYLGDNGILTTYSKLYNVAIATDDRAREESWNASYANMTTSTSEWKDAVDVYLKECAETHKEYSENVDGILETVGLSYDETTGKVEGMDSAIDDLVDANTSLTESITEEGGVIDTLGDELEAVREVTAAYAEQRDTILQDIEAYEKYLKILDEMISSATNDEDQEDILPETPTETEPTPVAEEPVEEETQIQSEANHWGVAYAIWNGNYSWGSGQTRKDRLTEKGFSYDEIQSMVNKGYKYVVAQANAQGITYKDLSKYGYSSFDTGGYTGEWGSEGKLALLHEKELILNEDDTENMLESLTASKALMDSINATIEMKAQLEMLSMNSLVSEISQLMNCLSSDQVLEQQITIYADFPDASEYQEIQMAFDNLINRASQYSNRTTLSNLQNKLV